MGKKPSKPRSEKKPVAEHLKKRKPGQQGARITDKIKLAPDQFTDREAKVFEVLRANSVPSTLGWIAKEAFPHLRPSTRAYRAAMNSLRRVVAAGYAKKVDRGTYAATAKAL